MRFVAQPCLLLTPQPFSRNLRLDLRRGPLQQTRVGPVLRQQFRRQAREHFERGQEGGFLLDDAVDREVADGKFEAHVFSQACYRVLSLT